MCQEGARSRMRKGSKQAWMAGEREEREGGQGGRKGGREGGREGGKKLGTHTTWRERARQGWAPLRVASTCEDSQGNLAPLVQPRPTVISWEGKGERQGGREGGKEESSVYRKVLFVYLLFHPTSSIPWPSSC